MSRNEQEMIMWLSEYVRSTMRDAANRAAEADAAVAEFRKRYPVEPDAPPAVWYDEPPFPKDGNSYPCWISGEDDACAVHWSGYAMFPTWVYSTTEDNSLVPLNGRRVCPITKPQEPTQ